jgi:hypothetical protein
MRSWRLPPAGRPRAVPPGPRWSCMLRWMRRSISRRVGGGLDHAQAASGAGVTEPGALISAEALSRLLCDAELRTVVEDGAGTVIGLGRRSRGVPARILRQLRRRDRGCSFPNCEHRRFTNAHPLVHIRRLSPAPVHSGQAHPMVASRRDHRPGQPGASVHVPSQARARARLGAHPRCRRRRGPLVPARRHEVPGWAGCGVRRYAWSFIDGAGGAVRPSPS